MYMYAGAGSSFKLQGVSVYSYLKKCWFSMKYIVKRKNNDILLAPECRVLFFPILSPCGYHKKRKTSHK